MADINLYQVTLDAEGNAVSVQLLPPEPEKPRVVFIREETPTKAKRVAEQFFAAASLVR